VLALATDAGRHPVVALACLDRTRRPLTIFVVEGSAAEPADLVVAVDALLDAAAECDGLSPLGAVVVATSRPGRPAAPTAGDLEAWDQLDQRCRAQGISLLDWFVVADGAAVSVATRGRRPSRWAR